MNPEPPERLSEADSEAIRKRQKAQARMMGLALGALAILFFFIALARLSSH